MKYDVILLAAGEGQRAALGYNKCLYKMNGQKELFLYSLDFFLNDEECEKIILVENVTDVQYINNLLSEINNPKIATTIGGETRGDSVYQGLKLVENDYVIVHDAARPLLYKEDILKLMNGATETGGATLASKVYNTTCHIVDGYVDEYFSRHTLASVITPQCFKATKLLEAYHKAAVNHLSFHDDSSIFKACGNSVKLIFTDNISIKATTPYDIKLLEVLLHANR